MCHPSGCYAKLLRILQLSKFTFFNAKIWLQLLRVPYNTPMCGAPPDCFAPAMSATASLTPSSPRLRARAGRLTVCGACSSTESLSLRCATRHLPFALILLWATPSSFHSFADIHLRFAPCVITAHRHRSTPRLDMSIGVKGERSAVASSAKPLHSVKNVNSHVAEI